MFLLKRSFDNSEPFIVNCVNYVNNSLVKLHIEKKEQQENMINVHTNTHIYSDPSLCSYYGIILLVIRDI